MFTMLQRSLLILALACVSPSFASDRDTLLDQANLLLLPRERAIPEFELVFSARPTRVLKTFNFTHCEKSHDLSDFAAERKEILSLLGIKTEVTHP